MKWKLRIWYTMGLKNLGKLQKKVVCCMCIFSYITLCHGSGNYCYQQTFAVFCCSMGAFQVVPFSYYLGGTTWMKCWTWCTCVNLLFLSAAAASASPTLARALAAVQQTQKRPRSEKKPIPTDQKDSKYFERRKRNNMAAKKSRDARKSREDEIAIRASFLEKENAILRAQVATLREEASSLKHLLLQKKGRTW